MTVILHAWSNIFPDLPIHDEIPWEIDSNLYYRKPWDSVLSHLASIIPELFLPRLLSFLIFPKPFHVLLGGNCENSNHRVECCDVNWFLWMIHVCFYMWVDTHLQMHDSLGFDVVSLFATLFWIHEALGVLLIPGLSLHWHFLNGSMQLETHVVTLLQPRNYVIGTIAPEMHWVRLAGPLESLFTTNTAKCYI